ncbi:MAG: chemotaxis protein CheW [Chryseolinea sp.]
METNKHLVFKIKEQLFTLPVIYVNTIIQLPRLFKVPQAPGYILGVINLEGNVIPVIDTSVKLGMSPLNLHDQSQVIVMQRKIEGQESFHLLGFVTEEVCDVANVEVTKMQALPNTRFEFDQRLVDGMHKINGEFCMQVNVSNFYKGEIDELIQSIADNNLPTQ